MPGTPGRGPAAPPGRSSRLTRGSLPGLGKNLGFGGRGPTLGMDPGRGKGPDPAETPGSRPVPGSPPVPVLPPAWPRRTPGRPARVPRRAAGSRLGGAMLAVAATAPVPVLGHNLALAAAPGTAATAADRSRGRPESREASVSRGRPGTAHRRPPGTGRTRERRNQRAGTRTPDGWPGTRQGRKTCAPAGTGHPPRSRCRETSLAPATALAGTRQGPVRPALALPPGTRRVAECRPARATDPDQETVGSEVAHHTQVGHRLARQRKSDRPARLPRDRAR